MRREAVPCREPAPAEDAPLPTTPEAAAVATAAAGSERILPRFAFDPAFSGEQGSTCDARIEVLHDCLRDLDPQYRDVDGAG